MVFTRFGAQEMAADIFLTLQLHKEIYFRSHVGHEYCHNIFNKFIAPMAEAWLQISIEFASWQKLSRQN